MRYLVVVEKGEASWEAHVPDLSDCIALYEQDGGFVLWPNGVATTAF